ncbi:hypothetical protein KJ877_10490 [bacterium]|nr:hypothetical protein [bacterium]MBU1989183.1 hypothetical protein [bacterium]
MAKKQKSIELSDKNISFNILNVEYRVIRFYPSKMTLDVMVHEDGVKQGVRDIPFAHLPKDIKKLIKPN